MFEYIVEPDKKKKVLDDIAAEALASKIVKDYDSYNHSRQSNLDKAEALQNEIFFKNTDGRKNREVGSTSDNTSVEEWKSNAKLGKSFMFYQTLKAFIWKNIYANINSMFDVSGENQETDNESNKQKAYLTDILEKMDFQQTCDKIIDYALIYGEISAFAAWKKKYEEYRRPIDYFKTLFQEDVNKLPLVLEAIAKGKTSYVDQKKVYDNPYVYPVNPANLVFDVAQKDNWDNCPKIYRTFKTPDEIINNKFYHIKKEDKEAIKNLISSASDSSYTDQSDRSLSNECINGNTVEVLDHWGDLKVDGELLKNWHAVVVARKFLVLFEKNNRIINPFTFGTLVEDPSTKRGISPLYSILDIAHMQEDLFNRTCDMQALSENPPVYAPEDFFADKDVKLYPGKIITYGDSLNPDRIKPMTFNVGVFLNDISYLNDLMAETSGIFPNMAGADEQKAKTATEISTKAQGQVTRLAMIIDTINQYLIIPVVEKVAKLCADFKSGEEQVYVNKDNKQDTITIDDNIRQGDYKYTYSDRTLTAERIEKADMVINAAKEFAQFIPLNVQELFTWYFEQKGVENPERFLNNNNIDPQIQEALLNNPQTAPLIQQMQQAVEVSRQQQGNNNASAPNKEPNQPQPQPQAPNIME